MKYPIVVKKMSDSETKEYHLKRLERLYSKKSELLIQPDWDEEMLSKRERNWL